MTMQLHVVKIETWCGKNKLGTGSGLYGPGVVITALHVLSGRYWDDQNGWQASHPSGAFPDRATIVDREGEIPLIGKDQQVLYWRHPQGACFDIAAISLGDIRSKIPIDRGFLRPPQSAGAGYVPGSHCKIELGDECEVYGYPQNANDCMMIKGAIASNAQSGILIDANTRGGMSGGPVFLKKGRDWRTLLGIYIGRITEPTIKEADATRGLLSSIQNTVRRETTTIGKITPVSAIYTVLATKHVRNLPW